MLNLGNGIFQKVMEKSWKVMDFSKSNVYEPCTLTKVYFFFQDAYNHVKNCRENMQPTRGFIEQLSRWEEKMFGSIVTDISEPEY